MEVDRVVGLVVGLSTAPSASTRSVGRAYAPKSTLNDRALRVVTVLME